MLAKERWQAGTIKVLEKVFEERIRQVQQYGHNEDLLDGIGMPWLRPLTDASAAEIEQSLRDDYEDFEATTGNPTWVHLIREELAEAFAEEDLDALIVELTQVAALCVSFIEKLQKRGRK